MGYYTAYDVTSNSDEVIDRLLEVSGYEDFDGEVKWYKSKEDCLLVSKEFPDQLIVVEAVGEDSGDVWKAYYKNGKSFTAKAKLVFEDFNESKLS